MNRWATLALMLVAAVALILRWPQPGQRPMHNDEAVNGIKFGTLWQEGRYRYDPNEHHGPTLYYFTAAVEKITRAPAKLAAISEERLRWVTVLFGVGLIALLLLFYDAIGRNGILWCALLTAVSPALVFYSQYYIHEILLAFFTTAVLGCGWRYWRSRKAVWATLTGVAFGLMAATKETFVLAVAAGVIALGLNQIWNRLIDASGTPARAASLNPAHLLAACVTAFCVAAIFFSSFFTNGAGPIDAIRTYLPWLTRAGAGVTPHTHPWYLYAQRLLFFHAPRGPVWSEGFIFALAVVGAYSGLSRKRLGDANASFVRFVTIFSFCLAGMHSSIPYKTPWCLATFWIGFILLAGAGAAWILRNLPRGWQYFAGLVLLGGAGHLAFEANRAVNEFGADQRNPYVYAQTSPDLLRLCDRVATLAQEENGAATLIKVIAKSGDYWPLPWYLRGFSNVGWWSALPKDPYAPIMIVSSDMHAELDKDRTHLMVGYYALRPSVFLELYVELELWKKYLAAHPVPVSEDS